MKLEGSNPSDKHSFPYSCAYCFLWVLFNDGDSCYDSVVLMVNECGENGAVVGW